MGDHDTRPTCLSAEPHGPEVIRDFLAHYFGCIEIHERPDFLSRTRNKAFWDKEVQLEIQKLNQQDGNDETQQDFRDRAEKNVKKKVHSLAVSIEAQHKRIIALRKALEGVECAHKEVESDDLDGERPEDCNLVKCLGASYANWRADVTTKRGIQEIREWRRAHDRPTDTFTPDPSTLDLGRREALEIIGWNNSTSDGSDDGGSQYDLERDINGYIIEWDICKPERKRTDNNDPHRRTASTSFTRPSIIPRQSIPAISRTTTVQLTEDTRSQQESDMREEARRPSLGVATNSHPSKSFYKALSADERYLISTDRQNDHRFKGKFPDQRLSLRFLLGESFGKPKSNDPEDADESEESDDESNVLNKNYYPDRVRYIHIPHNNMEWIEQAVARYFGDSKPDHRLMHRAPPIKTRSHMILQPEYWRDQQQGGRRGMIHARQMRAICERVSSDIWDSEDNPSNLVLFMPYLHWEEDRKRNQIAKIIDKQTAGHLNERDNKAKRAKKERIANRTFAGKPLTTTRTAPVHITATEDPNPSSRIKETLEKKSPTVPFSKPYRTVTEVAQVFNDKSGQVKNEKHGDGQAIWDVAKLAKSKHERFMARSRLGQLLLDAARLYEAMAIHRDQHILEKYLHHDPPMHPRRTLDQSYYWNLKPTKTRNREQVVYRGTAMDERNMHKLRERKKKKGDEQESFMWDGCDHCRSEIGKIGRIVMVDQLWMWILDKRTILTSFPERFGQTEDESDVHQSIRARIRNAHKNEIRSVFDIALIIFDECANGLLRHSLDQKQKPPVLDIFRETISNLAHRQTEVRGGLRKMTASASLSSEKNLYDVRETIRNLTKINFEGLFLDDIKKVIDELNIMLRMSQQHKVILRRFQEQVEAMADSDGHLRARRIAANDGLRQTSDTYDETYGQDEAESDDKAEDRINWFRVGVERVVSRIDGRIEELESLIKTAETTSRDINEVHNIVTQQANILQAWQAGQEASETVRHGRTIMVFTIVTVIFLPLSFMSNIFGMNNSDIGDNQMSFRDQASYMFPISVGVILFSVLFAFWTYPRSLLRSLCNIIATWLFVETGAYGAWMWLSNNLVSARRGLSPVMLDQMAQDMRSQARRENARNRAKHILERQSERPRLDV